MLLIIHYTYIIAFWPIIVCCFYATDIYYAHLNLKNIDPNTQKSVVKKRGLTGLPQPPACESNRLLTAGSDNVFAVTLMKLVKVLQLTWYQWQVVCSKCNTSTHNNQLSTKVIHHKAEEVIGH